MTMYDPSPGKSIWTGPRLGFAGLLALALLLSLTPPAASRPLRHNAHVLLRPGLSAMAWLVQRADSVGMALRGSTSRAQEWSDLQRQLAWLRDRNRELEAAALMRGSMAPASDRLEGVPLVHQPLLASRLIAARVLGRQAQAFLQQGMLVDAGRQAGVLPEAWVLDVPAAMLDRGTSAGVESGDWVLAGRRVWGKVQQVGETTSQIRPAQAAGYRDLVRLASRSHDRLALGPRGVLDGVGESLCRIRLVPVTEAVALGDLVLTDGGEGLLPTPLIYGEIVRLERPAGATHWEIWMRPALDETPQVVAVLSAEMPGRESEGDAKSLPELSSNMR